MDKQNTRSLWVISFVAVVNALGYGIIIPLLYSFGKEFGITNVQSGLLFASFSAAQFIATPIIGRLSDKYGRKPLLVFSVLGSALSFLLFGFANSALMLFAARILDGISGGNISVAQAVISDLTKPKERTKWFGMLGASFGFGFLFGPAIGGILSQYSVRLPFFLAAAVSLICALLAQFVLKESLQDKGTARLSLGSVFNFKKVFNSLFEPFVGLLLSITFLVNIAFSIFILGFQTFTNDSLKLPPSSVSLLFVIFGIVGLIMQGFVVGRVVKKIAEIPLLLFGVIVTAVGFGLMALSTTLLPFIGASIVVSIGNAFLAPVITSIISKHTKAEDQGGILGINQSYMSIANIFGPIIGGYLTIYSDQTAFVGAGIALLLAMVFVIIVSREKGRHTIDL
ncbi:MFS transporter [Candidatus Woesebacteria bacterium]|nr:MFS transporter [Candidatus Woesebacteria bacterium]